MVRVSADKTDLGVGGMDVVLAVPVLTSPKSTDESNIHPVISPL